MLFDLTEQAVAAGDADGVSEHSPSPAMAETLTYMRWSLMGGP
jgi:hypothetical protein